MDPLFSLCSTGAGLHIDIIRLKKKTFKDAKQAAIAAFDSCLVEVIRRFRNHSWHRFSDCTLESRLKARRKNFGDTLFEVFQESATTECQNFAWLPRYRNCLILVVRDCSAKSMVWAQNLGYNQSSNSYHKCHCVRQK